MRPPILFRALLFAFFAFLVTIAIPRLVHAATLDHLIDAPAVVHELPTVDVDEGACMPTPVDRAAVRESRRADLLRLSALEPAAQRCTWRRPTMAPLPDH